MTDPKIKLITPGKPPFEFPKSATKKQLATLESQLKGLGLSDPTGYLELYKTSKLDHQKLFIERGGPGATTGRVFPPLANPDGLIDFIQRPLRNRRDEAIKSARPNGEFIFKPTEEDEPPGEETVILDDQKAPPGAKKVTEATNKYLEKNSLKTPQPLNSSSAQKHPPAKLTDPWLDEDLPRHIRTLAKIAVSGEDGQGKGIIFHEPHHELSPGMILVNEIFKALLSRVADLIEEINGTTERAHRPPDLIPLVDFVNELNGIGDTSNEFTNFILPGGPHKRNDKIVPIDPTRVELFLDGGWIYGSAVIVGAWKGGTHSNGATHTS